MFSESSLFRRWLCAVLVFSVAGCAQTTFRGKVTKEDTNGIRYYLPATYILIKPDYTKGEPNVTYWIGPDTTALYAADPYAFASTNTTELQFTRGYLTQAKSNVDTTKVASEAIAALDELAKVVLTTAAKSAQLAATKGEPKKPPQIYLFVVGTDGKLRTLFSPDFWWLVPNAGIQVK